jgi:hypothetical protein
VKSTPEFRWLWNNVVLRLITSLSLLVLLASSAFSQDNQPHLLLTPRRLHRLKLDVQRQTDRWTALERRVKTTPESPERGFELALYSVLSGNPDYCLQAVAWGLGHPNAIRQSALIADWCRSGVSDSDRKRLLSASPKAGANPFEAARDALFVGIVNGEASRDSVRKQWSQLLPLIQRDPRACMPAIYALFEFLDAANQVFRVDLRQDDATLFTNLPAMFLLAMQPQQLERPDWKSRAGGLMLVNVDPNLQASSFVQGWAMEDPKTAREGPGVAYEFLWANPYLPGLGYYNMDPWVYDPQSALLLARKSWDVSSCWVEVFAGRVNSFQCPPRLLETATTFGKLTVQPLTAQCVEIQPRPNASTILSSLRPGEGVTWEADGRKFNGTADRSGLLLLSAMASGKVCQDNHKRSKSGDLRKSGGLL